LNQPAWIISPTCLSISEDRHNTSQNYNTRREAWAYHDIGKADDFSSSDRYLNLLFIHACGFPSCSLILYLAAATNADLSHSEASVHGIGMWVLQMWFAHGFR